MALANPTIPKFYANMFTNVVSPTEVTMLFGLHGAAITVVSISYGVAKSLAEKLTQAIKEYEEKTGTAVLNGETLEKAFQPQ